MSRRRWAPSKRRWKARCALGREIPYIAVVQYQLTRWWRFVPIEVNRDVHKAVPL